MEDNRYRLAGTLSVPMEKRQEFNRKVLDVLYHGGIRKTRIVYINGYNQMVVERPVPDREGMVYFDYSIFEKKKRETASFNTVTGELNVSEWGYAEYGVVVNMIMVLQQAYSSEPCYLTNNGKPVSVEGYLTALKTMIGEETTCENGMNAWQMMEFFHNSPDFEDLSSYDVLHALRQSGNTEWIRQIIFAFQIDNNPIKLTDEVEKMDSVMIRKAENWQQKEFLYRIMIRYKDDKDFDLWFKILLQCELDERRKLAERKDDLGIIAELSLKISAQGLANIYAKSKGESFWTIWDSLGIKGYRTYLEIDDDHNEMSEEALPFYTVIQRDTEDEFLEFWNGSNLKLSDSLRGQIEMWKDTFRSVDVSQTMEMEQELFNVLYEMEGIWECRYADKAFVDEFMKHKQDDNYKKLLMVMRDYLDKETSLFPELTKMQAKEWALKKCRNKHDSIMMSAYVSLMTNWGQRKKIFGV